MTHEIFKILDEYNLLKPQKRYTILSELREDDINIILKKLDGALDRTNKVSDQGLSINMPYPSIEIMGEITSYLFLCEKLHFPDPLTDYFGTLAWSSEDIYSGLAQIKSLDNQIYSEILDEISDFEHNIDRHEIDLLGIIRTVQLKRTNHLINYYIEYKDLIDEGVLMPFTDSTITFDLADRSISDRLVANIYDLGKKYAKSTIDKHKEEIVSKARSMKLAGQDLRSFIREVLPVVSQEALETGINVMFFTPTTMKLKEMFPASQSANLVMGGNKNQDYINDAIALVGESIGEKDLSITWPAIEDEISFLTIGNIHPQDLLSIRYKEKDALEKYRYSVQEKLLDIRNVVGTDDYKRLISKLSLEQKKQITEMSLLANHIKKDHLRKSSFQLTTTFLSAAGAILSAMASTQDPLALVGTGIASAGFTAGISKLVETWISYKGEIDKLREKDSYILWKLQKTNERG